MNLDTSLVGTLLKDYQTNITWRQTTNYAAAIEDNNPKYFDDRDDNKIVSHPMFPVSVTWRILSQLEKFIKSEDFPKQVLMTQVHYSEHLILNRLILPDDKLLITGSLKAFLPHRAGTHAIICLKAYDDNKALVFTEYIGAMLRGVWCEKECMVGKMPVVPDNNETKIHWTSDIHIDQERPYIYDGCANLEFPIHTSPKFAKMVGLPGIILQGTATLAYAVREFINNEANKDPGRIAEIACKFTGMVMPGTNIKVCCTGKKNHKNFIDIFFKVQNKDQKKAIRNGYLKILKTKE